MKRLLKWLVSLLLILVVAIGLLFVMHVWYFKLTQLDWFHTRVFAKGTPSAIRKCCRTCASSRSG